MGKVLDEVWGKFWDGESRRETVEKSAELNQTRLLISLKSWISSNLNWNQQVYCLTQPARYSYVIYFSYTFVDQLYLYRSTCRGLNWNSRGVNNLNVPRYVTFFLSCLIRSLVFFLQALSTSVWMNEWMNEWVSEGRKEGMKEWMQLKF